MKIRTLFFFILLAIVSVFALLEILLLTQSVLPALAIPAAGVLLGSAVLFLLRSFVASLTNLGKACSTGELAKDAPAAGKASCVELHAIQQRLASLHQQSAHAGRLRQIVDQIPFHVLALNKAHNWTIEEASAMTRATLSKLQGGDPTQGNGKKMVAFFREQEMVQNLIENPERLPWTTKTYVGTDPVTLTVAGLYDTEGRYTGPMLSWTVDTTTMKLVDDFQSLVRAVCETLLTSAKRLSDSANAVRYSASSTNEQAKEVSDLTQATSDNIQVVQTAAADLNHAIASMSEQVKKAAEVATNADRQATATSAAVASLDQAAAKIGEVVTLINDIASQTNLLALNATIEAARAGEAGKGFSVVASEVKTLATQTAKATEEISAQIGAIQTETRNAVDAIQAITGTISQVSQITSTIARSVTQQSETTGSIAKNIHEAVERVKSVAGRITSVRDATDRTRMTANDVVQSSENVHEHAKLLQNHVDLYMVELRSL